MRVLGFRNSFTAGEIGPEGWERVDLEQHAKGCAEAANLIALVTGPLASRGGFWDRGAAADETARTILVGFRRSVEDALILELGDGVARVFTVAGDPVMDGASPYEFATPWAAATLPLLWFKQVGDVLYVTRTDGGRTKTLTRLADDDWSVADYDFREGPWLPENTAINHQLTPSGVTGNIGLTASLPTFSPADVGTLIRLREGDGNPPHPTWTSKTSYSAGAIVQFDGKVYGVTGVGGTSGTTPPVHSSGQQSDGGVIWAFFHDGAGVVKITEYNNAQSVLATVVSPRLPSTGGTRYWARQAFSDDRGWPRALAEEREERLAFAGTLDQPARLDLTRTAGFGPTYGDFKPGLGTGRVVDDDAVSLTAGKAGARVVWLLAGTYLIAGTTDAEYAITGPTVDEPIAPNLPVAREISSYGSADVAPLLVQGPPPTILHVLRSRQVLNELRVAGDPQATVRRELALLAGHIWRRGIEQLAWQQPDNIVWVRLTDGGLAALAYHQEHNVAAATRMEIPAGFRVESIATAPQADGRDVLFASVYRDLDGTPQRRIWRMALRSEGMFLDAAEAYSGAPTNAVSGLDHLEGEAVTVVGDGALIGVRTVADGAVSLGGDYSEVVAGLPFRRRFESLPLDLEGVGETLARTVRVTHATVIVDCAEARVGTDAPHSHVTVRARTPDDLAAPVERRLRQRVAVGGGADRDRRLVVEDNGPFDLVLHGYRLEADAQR